MIDLHELEAIKQLKYRYMRAVDTKDYELLADTMTENATASYDSGKYAFNNRAEILAFLQEGMANIITLHQLHHPEIEITGDTATGIWYLQDFVMTPDNSYRLQGAAFYEDEYVKTDGNWKITSTGYVRTYEESAIGDAPLTLCADRFGFSKKNH
ncbi:MAG: nuclear transport factor 2 family protein [Pseudomonadales bacterium]